ncbi:MAG TPA: isoleucine--tRNA ligase, partial [Candidatus Veblenbacteria bacterium]|nr:isoleucine--tRNA ligase [Candidatus Veblenbacteria bacterium]
MVKFPDLEDKWLKYWQDNKIFEKSLAKPAPHGNFVFFEGPPTANGRPGIHHVLARAFKDLIPRYKTMRGFRVERKAGWDTQGLPVELQVEKELGFKGKPDIEKYGVKEFNNKCRADVWKYKEDWEKLTKRMGFWLDLEHPYVTYENYYLESLWWIFKQVDKAGLLYQDYKVLPHCPRCGTALSSHEVALGYKSIPDKAVYVKFKIKNQKSKIKIDENTYILSWTTTPWTLPGNVALTVGNNIEYTKARILPEAQFVNSVDPILNKSTEYVIFSREIFEKIPKSDLGRVFMGQALEEEENLKGKDLVGLEYEPLFDIKQLQNEKSHRVYAADFVTTTEGTGVVHTAVMYGEDDFNLGTAEGLPKYHTVDEAGNFTKDVPQWQGKFVKDKKIEQEIIDYLSEQGKKGFSGLFGEPHEYTHDYPFCWRCSTPLLYYAKPSWFIKMSALRDELQAANAKINWYPEHIKHGRFGEWLDGVKDWAISRERYWGTPLPIWRCTNDKCKHQVVIESLVDLAQTSGQEQVASGDFDMHRPFIDEVSWSCKKCDDKGEMKRVPEVADCWFDSGSMP